MCVVTDEKENEFVGVESVDGEKVTEISLGALQH